MNILFLGLLYDKDKESYYLKNSRVGLQTAINIFQWNIINGLENNLTKGKLDIMNCIPIGVYPSNYKKIILKNRIWLDSKNRLNYEIGCINLPLIKQIQRYLICKKNIEHWISNNKKNNKIIVYSLYPPYIKALRKIKKKFNEVEVIFIIPDLPSIYGVLPRNKFKRYVQLYRGNKMISNLSFIDKYILLTEQMKYPLNISTKPYEVLEGIVNINENKLLEDKNKLLRNKKIILYTGTLNYQFGIKNLLNAFTQIENDNYELWICGSGEAEEEIKKLSAIDNRIKFYGYLENSKIYELQQKTTILINPRTNEGNYTKYSFPSKTMEYMASGRPVLMYKLDGIPSEYDKYIYYVENNSIQTLKNRIIEICEKSEEELYKFGKDAKEFVLSTKNYDIQAKKILDLLLR